MKLMQNGAESVKQFTEVTDMINTAYAEEAGNNTMDQSTGELAFTIDDRGGIVQPPAQKAAAAVSSAASNISKPTKTGVTTTKVAPPAQTNVSGDKTSSTKTSSKTTTKDGNTSYTTNVTVQPAPAILNNYNANANSPGPTRK